MRFYRFKTSAHRRNKKTKKATERYNEYAFQEAIDKYEDLVSSGYSTADIYKNLGNAHFANAEYKEAATWFGELMGLEEEVEPEYLYRYALSLKSIGEYEESDVWMKKYLEINSEDLRAKRFSEKADYLKQIRERKADFDLINLSINTKESDFAPAILDRQLIFSTARDTGVARDKIHEWNNRAFLNLYQANILIDGRTDQASAKKLDRRINAKTHESSAVFTRDGQTMYFTRNNSKNGEFARDESGISRLKIYRAAKNKDSWKNLEELPFNSNDYSVAHPSLSQDDKRLYFASDMPGTHGASDIFYVDINEDGSFGKITNLGPEINTESRETFPYVDENNILYFASDGHPGLGGLDIFATPLEEEETAPVNLGEPINSPQDDFSFVKDPRNNNGYFASNRPGGKGSDDIYAFVMEEEVNKEMMDIIAPPCVSVLSGTVKDQETLEPLADSRVLIFDEEEKLLTAIMTDADGHFSMDADCIAGNFKIQATKTEYNDGLEIIDLIAEQSSDVEIFLEKDGRAPLGSDLLKHLNINPIFFDLNRSEIRRDAWVDLGKVITYLNAYPEANIRIRSHTDSRSSSSYNTKLSEARAYATLVYLVERGGIDPSRLTAQGFGETRLKNDCGDGVRCSEVEHQANRRSEFIIVE